MLNMIRHAQIFGDAIMSICVEEDGLIRYE